MSKAQDDIIHEGLSAQEALENLRKQLIKYVLRVVLWASTLALGISSYNAYLRQQSNLILIYAIAYGFLLAVVLWKKAPYVLRAGVVAALFYIIGIVDPTCKIFLQKLVFENDFTGDMSFFYIDGEFALPALEMR